MKKMRTTKSMHIELKMAFRGRILASSFLATIRARLTHERI